MRPPNPPPEDRLDPLVHGRRLLFVLILTAGLTLLGIGVIAFCCRHLVAPISHGPGFQAQFTVPEGFFYAGQPAKTAAYQLGCLATPFLLALSFWAARSWAGKLSDAWVDRFNRAGMILYLLLMVSCVWPILYCPHPPFWILPPSSILLPFDFSRPFYKPGRILFLLAAVAVEFFFLTRPPSRRNANRAVILLLLIWALLIPSRFYLPSEISDAPRYQYHLNAVLDSLSQSVNGHHILIDFPHIYGSYIEMLGPIIRLFPRGVGVLITALALPNVVGMLCLLLAARLLIRQPAILFVCGLTLLSTGFLGSSFDINYGYLTPRLFFPSIGLLAATLYFRRPGGILYALTSAVAALASIWNLDSGTVLWLSWVGTLLILSLVARNLPAILRHLLAQILFLGAAWIAFFLYLRMVSGHWPQVGLLFYFQKLVIDSGYFCLRLLFPDMWVFILTIYIGALAVVFCAWTLGRAGWLTPVMLMLSLLGIGIFSYFMGRSAQSNLVAVAYPAVLLAGILWAEAEVQMRKGKLPESARFILLPTKIAFLWWSFLMVAALPDLLSQSGHVMRHWRDANQTPFRADAAFVLQNVQPHEEGVYFLSNHSGIYYYLSDTVRSLKIPGTIELLRTPDMNVLIDAIRARKIRRLFVDQDFYQIMMYRDNVYDEIRAAIRENYQATQAGPTGRLVLYSPR